MFKKRLIGGIIVKNNLAIQSIGYKNYLPLGKPEIIAKNLDRWRADEILLNIIDRSKFNLEPNYEVLENIKTMNIRTPLIYGGGISSVFSAKKVIALGADRIILESVVEKDFIEFKRITDAIGSQSIIVSMPVSINNKNELIYYDYKKREEKKISKNLINAIDNNLFSELILIDYKNQGLMKGFNQKILKIFPYKIPLILYGGIYGEKNIKNILKDKRVNAVSMGNTLNYSEHSIQKTKSQLTKTYFRKPYYQEII